MKNGAVTYCRVSSEEQIKNNSLAIQKKDCTAAAIRLGCKVLKEFVEEGESGSNLDRTEIVKMFAFCSQHKAKIQYVIVKDVDRFSRDTYVHLVLRSQFRSLGIELYSVNQPNIAEGTPDSEFSEGMFSLFAQMERKKILQRTHKGTKESILRGGWTCKPPYGYRMDRRSDNLATLVEHPQESKVIVEAFELYAKGKNLIETTAKLNALGYRSQSGKPLSFQTVHNFLRNPAYIAKTDNKNFPDQLIDAVHKPIVSIQLWNKVQRRFARHGTQPTRQKFNPAFPLTTILRCSACNTPLTAGFSRGKSGKKYPYYHCRKAKCRTKSFKSTELENNFLDALRYVQFTEETMQHVEKNIIAHWRKKWLKQAEENRRLDREMMRLKEKKDQIEDKYIENKIPKDMYDRHIAKVSAEITNADQVREKLLISQERLRDLLKFTRDFLTSISNTWENASPMRKRLIQRVVFPIGIQLEANGTLGTLELPPMLELGKIPVADSSKLVASRGIEPLLPG